MKLELKHLAPYLPYVLKISNRNPLVGTRILDSDIENSDEIVNIGACIRLQYKPILRPLSHYKKWIIKDIKKDLECTHNQVMEFLCFMDGSISLDMATVGLYNIMCKKHIDFNGLIDKGLAIDINTL